MGIITKEVEIAVGRDCYKYYKMGYDVPIKKKEYKDGHKSILKNNMIFDTSKTIKIKVEDLSEWSLVRIEVECDYCGKQYSLAKGALFHYTTFRESGLVLCEHCAKSKYFVGEKATTYNPNKTDEERIKSRYNGKYVNMMRHVMKRDNYKCVICESKSNLNVHHLNSYADFPNERYDDSNCVTLCEDCHKKFHFIYGKKHNTKEQFEEWSHKILNLKQSNDEIKLEKSKKIYCYETDTVYDSRLICANSLNFNDKYISREIYNCCLYKKSSSVRGLHFAFADVVENMSLDEKIKYLLNKLLKFKNKVPFINLTTGVVYFTAIQCMKDMNFNKHYNLNSLRFNDEFILNKHYKCIPYYKFISFDEETQKKLCDKSIKLFNILEYKSTS